MNINSQNNNWRTVTLNGLLSKDSVFCDGDWVESKDQDPDGQVRLIQLADIGDGKFKNKSERFLTYDKALELGCTFLKKDDLLIARMPDPLGRACVFPLEGDGKYVTVVDICIVRPDIQKVDINFLKYWINAPQMRNKIAALESGTTRKRISRKNLATIDFPFPTLPIQQAIVAKIEELFSELETGVQELQTALKRLKIYRQAVLHHYLSNPDWGRTEIGNVCKCVVPNRDKPKSFSGGIHWVTIPDLPEQSTTINYLAVDLGLTEEEVSQYSARVIPIDSVIMTCVGRFGLSAVVEQPLVINQQLHAFLPTKNYLPKFIAYVIRLNKAYFERNATATTIAYLNKSKCNSMLIPLIDLNRQEQIVLEIEARLSETDIMENTIRQELIRAENLRQSVLKQAFEGKLVTEPSGVVVVEETSNTNKVASQKPDARSEQLSLF